MIVKNAVAVLLGTALIAPAAVAQAPAQETSAPAPRIFASEHVARIAGRNLRYTAAVEEFMLADPAGTPQASIFAISYIAKSEPGRGERPVIFVFNGGPGSSSVWLHLGFAGPRRLVLPDLVNPPTNPPFALTDNEESPLDVADIVLIDPPGTGFSTLLPGGRPEQFYGVQQDAAAMVRLIEAWIQRHDRWNAPRYLLSESYGTVRAAVVARLMAGGPMETGRMTGLPLSGVILLGQAMASDPGPDMAAVLALPSLAATACHFGKVASPCNVAQHVQQARDFAAGPYLTALYQGSALPQAERSAVASSVAALTGLAPQALLASDLRVTPAQFARTLLASDSRQIGLYDARFTLPLAPNGNDPVADDPAMGQYVPAFVGGLNGYMRRDLKVALDQPYEANVGALILLSQVMANYLSMVVPVPAKPLMAVTITLVFALNYRGVAVAARAQVALMLMLLAVLAIFVLTGLPALEAERIGAPTQMGWLAILAAVPLMASLFMGIESAVEIGEEIRHPGRNIPLGITLAILLTAAVYLLVAFVALGLAGPARLAESDAPLLDAARVSLGDLAVPLIVGAATVSILKTMNAAAMVFSRSLFAMARNEALPGALAAVHPRFGTPHRAIVTGYALAMAGLLMPSSILFLLLAVNIPTMLKYLACSFCAVKVARDHPDLHAKAEFRPSPMIIQLAGYAAIGSALAIILVGLEADWRPYLLVGGWLAIGCFYWLALSAKTA